MSNSEECFGAVLYQRVAPGSTEEFVRKTLVDRCGYVAGAQLTRYQTMPPDTDRWSRMRKISPLSFSDLLENCRNGKARNIITEGNSHESDDVPFGLDMCLVPRTAGCLSLRLTGSRALFCQDALIAYLRDIVYAFETCCGVILEGPDFATMGSALTLIPTLPWGEELSSELEKFKEELLFYQGHERELCERIPRANWGNILSPAHIEGLGGEERIRAESPCSLVERWGECLYLQLTESLWDVTKEQLLELNKFLEPIRFAGSPEPVYL